MRIDIAFWSVDQEVSLFCCCFSSGSHFFIILEEANYGDIYFFYPRLKKSRIMAWCCPSVRPFVLKQSSRYFHDILWKCIKGQDNVPYTK